MDVLMINWIQYLRPRPLLESCSVARKAKKSKFPKISLHPPLTSVRIKWLNHAFQIFSDPTDQILRDKLIILWLCCKKPPQNKCIISQSKLLRKTLLVPCAWCDAGITQFGLWLQRLINKLSNIKLISNLRSYIAKSRLIPASWMWRSFSFLFYDRKLNIFELWIKQHLGLWHFFITWIIEKMIGGLIDIINCSRLQPNEHFVVGHPPQYIHVKGTVWHCLHGYSCLKRNSFTLFTSLSRV